MYKLWNREYRKEWTKLLLSGPTSCGTITALVRCIDGLGIRSRFKGTITDIDVSAGAVSLLGLHAAIDQPEGMDMTGDVPENGETNVDQEVTTAAGDEGCRGRWKDDSDKDEADV